MINATTTSNAEGVLREQVAAAPRRRINGQVFLLLLAGELLLLGAVLIWAIFWLLPSSTPYAPAQDITPVYEAVRNHLSGAVHDPLIEVTPGVSARASNLRGFRSNGSVFYYYVEGRSNYDPLSRGAVSVEEVEVLLRDDSGPAPLVIYRLR